MEPTRVTLIILVCVFGRSFGTEVNVRAKPGDNVTLYCDSIIQTGLNIVWMRKCSHENQPSLFINPPKLFLGHFPRFNFVLNSSSNSYDLQIQNVSVSDEGIYYCGKGKTKISANERSITTKYEVVYGNETSRLSVLEPMSDCVERLNITSSLPAVSDCVFCWILLFSVCPVCVLVSSLLSSICVYCFCRPQTTGSDLSLGILTANIFKADSLEELHCETSRAGQICVHTEVSYSLITSEHP